MSRLSNLALIVVAGLVLLLPAIINGSVLLFPDSVAYYNAGEASLDSAARLLGRTAPPAAPPAALPPPGGGGATPSLDQRSDDGISTSRSVYFGIPMVLLYRAGGDWAIPLAAIAVTLICLFAALPLLLGTDIRRSSLVIMLLGLFAGLAVVAVAAMPDLFTGLMILAFAMLAGFWSRLSTPARCGWLVMLLAACLFHKSNLAVAAVLVAAYGLVAIAGRAPRQLLAMLAGVLILGFAGHALVSMVIERVTKRPAIDAPFLLARVIGDGTAERYLDANCGQARLVMCKYRGLMPMTENEFLWSPIPGNGLMQTVPIPERQAITAEANGIVIGTVTQFPGAQLAASTRNFVRQFFLAGVTEYLVKPRPFASQTSGLAELIDRYPGTAAGRGTLPLGAVSVLMQIVYVAALLAVLGLVLGPRRAAFGRPLRPEVIALAWILFGIVVNAAVSGVLAGVFDRYQGRVAWLMPLAALIALRIAFGRRGTVPTAIG